MDLRGRLDRSGDLQTSLRSSVGGRSSISELDTRDLQDFLADDYVETYEGPRTPARPPPAVVALAPRGGVATSARARLRADDGRRLVNGYELLGELGRGAFGTVELCERRGDLYAVKILRKSLLRKARTGRGRGANALADARREIAIMKKLDHANLVGLVEAVDDEKAGKLYLVLEYVDCGPVLERRKSGDPPYVAIDAVAARAACRDVLRGLEYLHASGVVHLDVKPENVLLTSGGVAKLCDFGVSRLARGGAGDAAVFASTPAFSAPELCGYGAGSAAAPAVDAWALGATLHAMVSGAPPVPPGTPAATVARLGAGERVVRPTGDGRLDALLARLLDVDAKTRATIPEAMASPWLDPPMTPVAYVGAAVRPEDLEAALTARSARPAAGRLRAAVGGLARRALGRGAALPETPTRRDRALDALRCSLSGGRAGSDDDGFDSAEALSDSGLDATFDALCGVGDGDESDDDGGPWPATFGGERLGPCFVAVAASAGDGRAANEDAWAAVVRGDGAAVLCVFDGHGGAQAAAWLAEHFPAYVDAAATPDDVSRAFAAADADLLRHLDKIDSSAGATAVVAVVSERAVVVANVGDSHAALAPTRGPAATLSAAHGLGGDPGEFERVKACGAHWANGGRVNGVLRVSRAFGDRDFKGARALLHGRLGQPPFAFIPVRHDWGSSMDEDQGPEEVPRSPTSTMERVDLTGSKGCICADEGPEEVPSSKPRRPSAAGADPEEVTHGKAVAWYDNDGSRSFTERTRRESGVVWSRSVSDIAGDEDEDEPETLARPGAAEDEAAAPARKPPKRSASILAPHDFEPTYFYLPDYCDNCGGVIVGNGFRCRGACGFKIHRGLGKGTENCHADVLLTLCEKREGHEHSWDTGDLAKQIARNTHQAVKRVVPRPVSLPRRDPPRFPGTRSSPRPSTSRRTGASSTGSRPGPSSSARTGRTTASSSSSRRPSSRSRSSPTPSATCSCARCASRGRTRRPSTSTSPSSPAPSRRSRSSPSARCSSSPSSSPRVSGCATAPGSTSSSTR